MSDLGLTAEELLMHLPILVIGITFMLGAIIGSFINVVVYRLPIMLEHQWQSQAHEILESTPEQPRSDATFNLILPNSHCPNCNTEIKPWHNIPILSYLALGGKCAYCKVPISLRYPLVEAMTAFLSCIIVYAFNPGWAGLAALVFTWILIALSLIDYDHQLLPDQLTLGLLWLGLIINTEGVFSEFTAAFWGAVWGYLTLWLVFWLFKFITGKEGMGYGDFKLLAALGAWVGWMSLPTVIILSSLSGSLIGGTLILLGRDRKKPIPFGPYLAIAGFVTLVWGDWISRTYNEWFILGV